MMTVKFGFGGLPTDLDVRMLQEKFGVPQEGDLIPYLLISECLKKGRETSRWKSVVGAWRKKLERDHNLVLKAIKNQGFKVCDPRDRLDVFGRKFKGGLRQVSRATLGAARTSRKGLTPEENRTLDYLQNTGAALRLQAATAAKQITYDPEKKNGA